MKEPGRFQFWSLRYVELKDGTMLVTNRDGKLRTATPIVEDVRICTPKLQESNDRKNVFEVVMPQKSFLLQVSAAPSSERASCDNCIVTCKCGRSVLSSTWGLSSQATIAQAATFDMVPFTFGTSRDNGMCVRVRV
jgi:hypothetical protein